MRTSVNQITLFLVTALFVLTLTANPAAGQTTYAPTLLGDLGGGQSEAYAVNDYGQVVGRAFDLNGEPHVFHWYNGEMVALYQETPWGRVTLPNAVYTVAYGISNSDYIASYIMEESELDPSLLIPSAVLFRPGVMTDLSTPYPGEAITYLGIYCSPTDISPSGRYVVGWGHLDCSDRIDAFLVTPTDGQWNDPDGTCVNNALVHDLGTLGGEDQSSGATAVNDQGVVVGWSADPAGGYTAFILVPTVDLEGNPQGWFLDDGTGANALMTSLGTLPGSDGLTFGHNSWARGINNLNQVVGEADTGDFTTHAFFWNDGELTDLGTLGGDNSSAAAINDEGVVVGWALDSEGNKRAFVLFPADTDGDDQPDTWYLDEDGDGLNDLMYDLNDLLPSGFQLRLTEARDINARGHIVGWGTSTSAGDTVRGAVLLTPAGIAESQSDGTGTESQETSPQDPELSPLLASGEETEGGEQSISTLPTYDLYHWLCGVGIVLVLPLGLAGLGGMKLALRRR